MNVLELARAKVAELNNRVSHGTVPSSVPWDSGRRTGADGANGTDGPIGADGTFGATASEIRPGTPLGPATITDDDDGDRGTADARAPADHGTTQWSAVADSHREHILARLDALPPASNDDGRRLLEITRSFLDSEHWPAAVAMGWSLLELFGIDPSAPLTCLDGHGLVTGLALSRLKGGCLETFAEHQAAIRCRSGSKVTYRRGSVAPDAAVPWWDSPALVASSEYEQ